MPNERETIIEHYITAYNHMDVEGMCQDLHSDIQFENSSDGEINMTLHGLEDFRKQAEAAKAYFTEREQTIKAIQWQGDTATVEIAYKGVLAVDLPHGMKAGDTLEMNGQSVFVFEGDQIIQLQDKS